MSRDKDTLVKLVVLSLEGKFLGCKGENGWNLATSFSPQGNLPISEVETEDKSIKSLSDAYEQFEKTGKAPFDWMLKTPYGCIVSVLGDSPEGVDELFRYTVFKNKEGYVSAKGFR